MRCLEHWSVGCPAAAGPGRLVIWGSCGLFWFVGLSVGLSYGGGFGIGIWNLWLWFVTLHISRQATRDRTALGQMKQCTGAFLATNRCRFRLGCSVHS